MRAKVAVENVSKNYATDQGPLRVLAGIEFAIDEGEFVALVGPSRCGKTTLLNIIAGFDRPDDGRVTIDGTFEPRTISASAVRSFSFRS